jgi:molybdenum cofactor biosynthesis enzyme
VLQLQKAQSSALKSRILWKMRGRLRLTQTSPATKREASTTVAVITAATITAATGVAVEVLAAVVVTIVTIRRPRD